MKVAYFDCQFGASGDMLLGALVGSGLPIEAWLAETQKIALPEGSFNICVSDVIRCAIAAKKVDVECGVRSVAAHSESPVASPVGAASASVVPAAIGPHDIRNQKRIHDNGLPYAQESVALERTAHGSSHTYEHGHSHEHSHDHHHSHDREHSHAHSHAHSHEHQHSHEHGSFGHSHDHGERHLSEILSIIESSAISNNAKKLASEIFERLGRAEARVHGTTVEDIHFHEVGAVDAIVDIVGFAIGYDMLGIERSVVSAVPLGSGTIKTMHGIYPIPGPAVLEMLRESGCPTTGLHLNHECLTPTGAAILLTVASRFGAAPPMDCVDSIGYGAGTFDPSGVPNVVRLVVGEQSKLQPETNGAAAFSSEFICVLEANIDDYSPQGLAFASERFISEGALDVVVSPVVMKKGRPAHLLTVLCRTEDRGKFENLIVRETTTIGVRSHIVERLVAARAFEEVSLNSERIRMKVARDLSGRVVNVQPEYEDCSAYATKHDVPLKVVIADAIRLFAASKTDPS